MHAWGAIQKAVDYIEENLSEKITPETLAMIVDLSPFYFQRLFTRLVNRPVSDYIKMRRLARSCAMLQNKDVRILDVAIENGFNSHESFTKAFKSAFSITPKEYRTNPIHLNQVIKPELLLNYTMVEENVPLITENIVLEITRKTLDRSEIFIGLSRQVPFSHATLGESTGIDTPGQLWDLFHDIKPNIPNLMPDGIELGASMMSGTNDGTFTYFVGGEAVSATSVARKYTTWELPATEYIVCCIEAENFVELTTSALGKAMKYLFGTWLHSRKLVTQPVSIEKYYKTTSEATYMEVWVIPIPTEE